MNRFQLDLCVVKAKDKGDRLWEAVRASHKPEHQYDAFADLCEKVYHQDTKLDNYLMFEMFLRAGKHMPAAVKIDNRTKADKLREEILKS